MNPFRTPESCLVCLRPLNMAADSRVLLYLHHQTRLNVAYGWLLVFTYVTHIW
jgi:hypothetical protein